MHVEGNTKMRNGRLVFTIVVSVSLFVSALAYPQQRERAAVELQQVVKLQEIQARHENLVLAVPGVVGIGIGLTEEGKGLAFIVYVEKLTAALKVQLPEHIEGVPVRLFESGIIKAY